MPSAAVPKGSADDEDSRTEWDHDLDGRAADELDEFFWHFDMLCDGDRNAFFDRALQHAIRRIQEQNAAAHILDIGTGSGLLALLADGHGADFVTAIERVPKLAEIAMRNFKLQKATVCLLRGSSRDLGCWPCKRNDIKSASTCISIASGQLHPSKPNLVVAELLETGLLGEGMLPTLRHAAKHLLAPGFAAIPAATLVYAKLVRGAALRDSETVPDISESSVRACSGAAAPWYVHADAMQRQGLISDVSDACEVLRFDWEGDLPGPEGRSTTTQVMLSSAGSIDGILLYWTSTVAQQDSQLELSTAPDGTYRRDHWRQALYTRCSSNPSVRQAMADGLAEGTLVNVSTHHDDYQIWFDIDIAAANQSDTAAQHSTQMSTSSSLEPNDVLSAAGVWPQMSPTDKPRPPLCTCGIHTALSRQACWARNDMLRQNRLHQAGCKPGDADFGNGPLAQIRCLHHISSQVAHTTAQGLWQPRLPSRVELYAQAICCPAVTRQFESTNGQPPFRRSGDRYLAQTAEMDSLRATRLGIVVPRTAALWEFTHELKSAPVHVGCVRRERLIEAREPIITSDRLDFGPGSSNADAVALWCDLVYEQSHGVDKNLIVLPGGAAGGPYQMCDIVPIAWAHREMVDSRAEAHDGCGMMSVRIRLDWANNWAQCTALPQSDPDCRCRTVGSDVIAPSESVDRRKVPRYS